MKINFRFLMYISIVALYFTPAFCSGMDVAIIVNKENPVDELSISDLKKIFLMEKKFWKIDQKIYPVFLKEGNIEKKIILDKIYKMSSADLKRYWLEQIYKGQITEFPKTLDSCESVKLFIKEVPNSIGFVDMRLIDESIKVIKIQGKLPGEAGYFISEPFEK